ncbi:MAG: hypothetical protein VZS44_00245 [Bacilli bacterium]|nr:hypothetical protein [Bacilli bacterium]
MNGFLVPANAKRGTLIFNIFRPVDLLIFGCGLGASLLMLLLLPSGSNIWIAILCILPACITGLLVFPIPNYQNVLCVLISIYQFYTERRRYVWKGWCFSEQIRYEQERGKSAK